MKIIFKPKNQLTEKLVLDERLTLDEDFDLLSVAKYNAQIQACLDQVIQIKQDTQKNILDWADKINGTIALNKLKKDSLQLKNEMADKAKEATLKNTLKVFLDNYKTAISPLENLQIKNLSADKLSNTLDNLLKNIAPKQGSELTAWLAEKNDEINLNNKALIDSLIINIDNLIKNINDTCKSIAANFNKDSIANIKKIKKSTKAKQNYINMADTEAIDTTVEDLCRSILDDFLKLQKIITDSCNANKTNTDGINFIKVLNSLQELNKTTDSTILNLKENISKVNKEINELTQHETNKQLDILANGKEENGLPQNHDWKKELSGILNSHKLTPSALSQKLKEFWDSYYKNRWSDNNTVKKLGKTFQDDLYKYGFDITDNPLIAYVGNIIDNKILLTETQYIAIHNSVARKCVTDEDLKDPKNNPVLYTKNLYTFDNSRIKEYLDLYNDIRNSLEDKTKPISENSIINKKYSKDEETRKNLLIDLFFEPGNPLVASDQRVAGRTHGKLKELNQIKKEWVTITGTQIKSKKPDLDAQSIIDKIKTKPKDESKEIAKKYIKFLLNKYNTDNAVLSKNQVVLLTTDLGLNNIKLDSEYAEKLANYFNKYNMTNSIVKSLLIKLEKIAAAEDN